MASCDKNNDANDEGIDRLDRLTMEIQYCEDVMGVRYELIEIK